MTDPSLLLNPGTLQIGAAPGRDELEQLLVNGIVPSVVIPQRELAETIWDEEQHPRWPPGAKDAQGHNIAGQFMRAGQTFMHGGHRWEIAQIAMGHIVANEASGDIAHAATKVFAPTQMKFDDGLHPSIEGATAAPPKHLKGGKGKSSSGNTPIVDASTHPETHDPSINLPSGSPLTPEDWEKFGRADQLYYCELMKRYGAWSSTSSLAASPYPHQSKLQTLYKKATKDFGDADAGQIVKAAFSSQYGSSSGHTLNLVSVFNGISASDATGLANATKRYERAREVESEINGVVAWDLFNRTRSPDVSIVHKTSDGEGFFADIVSGQSPLMSALSNSWLTTVWSGSGVIGWAVPIRHIVLATDVIGGSYHHEHEFAAADRMKLNPENAVFWTQSQVPQEGPIGKWLSNQMQGNPAGGSAIKGLAGHLAGKSELPLPPADSNFTVAFKPGEKTWQIPPDSFMFDVEKKVAATPGTPQDEKATPASELKPGDVISGNDPSLRYLVVNDPGLGPGTIRYLALGKGAPGNYDTSAAETGKNYTTSSARRRVFNADGSAMHFDIPPPAAKEEVAVTHNPDDFALAGEPMKVKDMPVGSLIRVNADDWEITSQSTTAVAIKSLTTETEASVNPLWKTQMLEAVGAKLDLEPGSLVIANSFDHGPVVGKVVEKTDDATPKWLVQMPNGEDQTFPAGALSPMPSHHPGAPQKGDTFAFDGTKMTVTNVLKDGTVRAKGGPDSAWPKVIPFESDSLLLKNLIRPSAYALGEKGKLGQMPAGTLFSGSPAKPRPYMVLGTIGQQTHVVNLDTGEQSALGKNKGYPLLKTAAEVQPSSPAVKDATVEAIPHDDFAPGDKVPLNQLQAGDVFVPETGSQVGSAMQITGETTLQGEPQWMVTKLSTGVSIAIPKGLTAVMFQGHEELPPEVSGPTAKIEDLQVGAQFLTPTVEQGGGVWLQNKVKEAVGGGNLSEPWTVTEKKASEGPGQPGLMLISHHGVEHEIHYPGSGVSQQAVTVVEADRTPALTDSGELPDAVTDGGFQPFKSNAGPGNAYKHDKLKMFADGTVFVDKTGKPWMVKQSGAEPVITDGTQLFKVDGNLRGKHSDHVKGAVVFEDHSSPPAVAAEKALLPNTAGHSLADLGLHPGDKFEYGGKVWTVAWIPDSGVFGMDSTGAEKHFQPFAIPKKVSTLPPEPPEGVPVPETHSTWVNALEPGDKAVYLLDKKLLPVEVESVGMNSVTVVTGDGKKYGAAKNDLAPPVTNAHLFEPWTPAGDLFTEHSGVTDPDGAFTNTVYKNGDGFLIYKRPDGEWHYLGGPELTPGGGLLTQMKVNGPVAAELQHTTVKKDIHDIETGQAFWIGNKPFVMLGHGSSGVDALSLETGKIIPADADQHKDFELASSIVTPPSPLAGPPPEPEMPTVGDLKKGDKFIVPAGYSGEGTEHEVIDGTPLPQQGGEYNAVKTKSIESGKEGLTATSLVPSMVTPAPAPAPEPDEDGWQDLAGWNKTVGTKKLHVGDKFIDGDGDHHTVTKVSGNSDEGMQEIETDWGSGLKGSEEPNHGQWTTIGIKKLLRGGGTPPVSSALPLEPYGSKWASGGKSMYPHIKDLAPEQVFADKKGKTFKVISHEADSTLAIPWTNGMASGDGVMVPHTFTDAKGKSKLTRVKDAGIAAAPSTDITYLGKKLADVLDVGDTYSFSGVSPGWEYHVISKGPKGLVVQQGTDGPQLSVSPEDTFSSGVSITKAAPPEEKPVELTAPVDDEHAKAMEAADEWLQAHDVPFPTMNKIHAAVAEFKADNPDSSWGKAYQLGTVVHTDLTGSQTEPLKATVDASAPSVPAGAVATTALKPDDKITFGEDGLNTFTVVKSPNATGSFQVKSDQSGLVQQYNAKNVPHVWPATAEPPTLPTGWETSPTPLKVSNMVWSPGDQFIDESGDTHTVVSQADDGAVATTWGASNQFGPVSWSGDELTTKAWVWHKGVSPSPPASSGEPIPDYSGTVLSGGKSAGGTTGAQFLNGPGGQKWLRKQYGGNQDRVATELLANAVYRTLGVKAAEAGTQKGKDGSVALAYPLLPGKTAHFSGDDAKKKALGEDFMADALVANYDFVGAVQDNVLWNGDEPTRVDQGGTFEYRAQGDPKKFGPVPTEVFSMLSMGQGKNGVIVSESGMRQQAAKIAQTLTPEKIDELVAAAPFKNKPMQERIRKALHARVEWMKEFGDGEHDIPDDVPLSSETSEPAAAVGAQVAAHSMKAGDKIQALPGKSVQGNHGDTWVVNGPSDDGQHWSLTNEAGWASTTIPKDDTVYEHVGYGEPFYPEEVPEKKSLAEHDLKPGDEVQFGGNVYTVLSPPSGPVVATRQKGTGLEVELSLLGKPDKVTPAPLTPAGLGGSLFKSLAVGDHFSSLGATWMKSSPYDAKVVSVQEPSIAGAYNGDVGSFHKISDVEYVYPVDHPEAGQEIPAPTPDWMKEPGGPHAEMPIKPYGSKWASGGAFTYPAIHELSPGNQFRDKSGKLFTVTAGANTPAAHTLALGEDGKSLLIPHTFKDAKTGKSKPTRVKKGEG